jgi:hypothetical protein
MCFLSLTGRANNDTSPEGHDDKRRDAPALKGATGGTDQYTSIKRAFSPSLLDLDDLTEAVGRLLQSPEQHAAKTSPLTSNLRSARSGASHVVEAPEAP